MPRPIELSVLILQACCEAGLSLQEIGEELDNAGVRTPLGRRLAPDVVRRIVPLLPDGLEYEVEKYWEATQVKRAIDRAGLTRENKREVSWLRKKRRNARMDAVINEL